MRGDSVNQGELFSYVSLESRIPDNHPAPYVGLTYEVFQRTTLYASYSEVFKAQKSA